MKKIKIIIKKLLIMILQPKTLCLRHPEAPGMRIHVTRTWIGRLLKSKVFATPGEVFDAYWRGDFKL